MSINSQNFINYFAEFRNMPKEWVEAQNFLNWFIPQIVNYLNSKSIGIYSTQEIPSGKQLYITSSAYDVQRKTINFGPLPASTTKSVAHGIDTSNGITLFNLYLSANKYTPTRSYFCLQYYSLNAADSIRLWMDDTNVNVITTADYSAYTNCRIVIEYVRGQQL